LTKSSQLALTTCELDGIHKDLCWADDPDLKARAEALTKKMQLLETYISDVQKALEETKRVDEEFERRRDLLLAGGGTPLEST
jgi:hypothetical protein